MATKEKPKSAVKIRQKKLVEKIVDNRGEPLGKLMKETGYSDAYATNPKQLTNTKSWQELMEEYLPDELLTRKHNELLNKKEVLVVRNGHDTDYILTEQPETNAVKAGVEMGYKLKGKFAPDKIEHTITAVRIINYGDNPSD